MASNDKVTEEAIKNLAVMFPNIDREMITDIFLGCKRDFDSTVDQLVNMGAEVKKPEKPEKQADQATPVSSPTPNINNLKDNNAEIKRLEELNQQLTREYRRLADMQESNMNLERQLSLTRGGVIAEQQKLEEEKKKLEEQQQAFQLDKKKLEEHLSARLHEMKANIYEQIRKSEEENKQKEIENTRLEELARDEQLRLEQEARKRTKAAKKEAKQKAKEEKRLRKDELLAEETKLAEEKDVEHDKVIQQLMGRERDLVNENETLKSRVADLEERILEVRAQFDRNAGDSAALAKQSVVESLQSVVERLNLGIIDFANGKGSIADMKGDLLSALRDRL